MAVTILEHLEEALKGIDEAKSNPFVLLGVKSTLEQATGLLEKGYPVSTMVRPLLSAYGNIYNVPPYEHGKTFVESGDILPVFSEMTEVRIHEFKIVTIDKTLEGLVDDMEEREVRVSIDLSRIESIYQTWGEESDNRARIGLKSGEEFIVLCTYEEAVRIWKYGN